MTDKIDTGPIREILARLRARRIKAGAKPWAIGGAQSYAARACGVSSRTVRRWVAGQQVPRRHLLRLERLAIQR